MTPKNMFNKGQKSANAAAVPIVLDFDSLNDDIKAEVENIIAAVDTNNPEHAKAFASDVLGRHADTMSSIRSAFHDEIETVIDPVTTAFSFVSSYYDTLSKTMESLKAAPNDKETWGQISFDPEAERKAEEQDQRLISSAKQEFYRVKSSTLAAKKVAADILPVLPGKNKFVDAKIDTITRTTNEIAKHFMAAYEILARNQGSEKDSFCVELTRRVKPMLEALEDSAQMTVLCHSMKRTLERIRQTSEVLVRPDSFLKQSPQ